MKTILITRETDSGDPLSVYCESEGINLAALPFIRLKKIETDQNHTREILFFGSKNGFDFYRQNFDLSAQSILACIGNATRLHIESKGFKLQFTGEKSGDPEAVSRDLEKWLKGRRITLVFSDQSTKSIRTALAEGQYDELIVYQTIAEVQKLENPPGTIVFTSPSNVRSYLLQHELPKQARVIAWGKSTKKTLSEQGIEPDYTLRKSTPEELIQYLQSL